MKFESALAKAIKASDILAVKVKRRASRIIENAEQPLLARLAALDTYNAASEVRYQGEALTQRMTTVFNGARTVNNEMGKALHNPNYKWEDLQAFIAKVDEVVAQIEKATAIVKRIGGLLVLL